MKRVTVRDLRYHFSEIEARLRRGEVVEIHKRKKVIARLQPVRPRASAYPDFAALQKEILGNKVVKVTGAELVAWDREGH